MSRDTGADGSICKIAVLGAGAVGCYYGAMLARAGHRVTIIARPARVEAIKQRGLTLEFAGHSESIQVEATTSAAWSGEADLVLICVKSDDTEEAGREIAEAMGKDAVVLCLQNGLDNAARLEAVIKRPVGSAAVYVAAEMADVGHVRRHGRGELVIGASPRAQNIAHAFRSAGVPIEISENLIGVLWDKLIVNCAYNAISAVSRLPYGRMIRVPGVHDVMRDVIAECVAVAEAENIRIPEDREETVLAIAESMPNQLSSTAHDLARGRRTEIEHLNGYIVRSGDSHGVSTPVNRTLLAMVRLLEEQVKKSE